MIASRWIVPTGTLIVIYFEYNAMISVRSISGIPRAGEVESALFTNNAAINDSNTGSAEVGKVGSDAYIDVYAGGVGRGIWVEREIGDIG